MTELKPCPFCGGKAVAKWQDNSVYIQCVICHTRSGGVYCGAQNLRENLLLATSEAIKGWNRRQHE